MSNVKPGEIIRVTAEQVDVDGLVISDVVMNMYGFDRETGNMGTRSIITTMVGLTEEWEKARGGVKGEKPGAIR